MKNIKLLVLVFAAAVIMQACSPPDGEHPGSEYMPDMGHSIAVEANVLNDYYWNTWDEASTIELRDLVKHPGQPVSGTVPRGYAGGAESLGTHRGGDDITTMAIPVNGQVPYYYEDTEEDRVLATAELLDNPFPITADGLARAKGLYEIYCGVCHGNSGDGLGYIYDTDQNPDAKYPLAPANLINDIFSAASNGQFYHAIMYGKNAMGAYKDKLSYEERWQVIHYIRSLQAKEAGATYNEDENTYNMAFGTPASMMEQMAEDLHMEEDHNEGDDHGEAAPADHEGDHGGSH